VKAIALWAGLSLALALPVQGAQANTTAEQVERSSASRHLVVVRGMRPTGARFDQLSPTIDSGFAEVARTPACATMTCAFIVERIDGQWAHSTVRADEERYLLEMQADLQSQGIMFVLVNPGSNRTRAADLSLRPQQTPIMRQSSAVETRVNDERVTPPPPTRSRRGVQPMQ
jgi:hypothetical protein